MTTIEQRRFLSRQRKAALLSIKPPVLTPEQSREAELTYNAIIITPLQDGLVRRLVVNPVLSVVIGNRKLAEAALEAKNGHYTSTKLLLGESHRRGRVAEEVLAVACEKSADLADSSGDALGEYTYRMRRTAAALRGQPEPLRPDREPIN